MRTFCKISTEADGEPVTFINCLSNMNQEKRQHRLLKRDIKKSGTRKMRRAMDRQLQQSPEEAADFEFDYGCDSSAPLNGNDHDATRRPRSEDA